MPLEITMDGVSEKGIRKENQDTFFIGGPINAALIIDGVGSLPQSKTFAKAVRKYCADYFMDCHLETWLEPKSHLRMFKKKAVHSLIEDIAINSFHYVHEKAFYAFNNKDFEGTLAGASTLTMMLVHGDEFVIGNVGDSNVYRLRKGYLERLTKPDVIDGVLEDIDLSFLGGMQRSVKSVLLQAIGVKTIEPHIMKGTLRAGDVFLLCTDGIDDTLTQPTIKKLLGDRSTTPKDLVKAASTMGSKDNMTAVLVRVHEKGTQKNWWQFWK